MILKGVGIGRGVAVGPVLRMAEPLPEPKDEPRAASVSAEAENARVTKALAAVNADLNRRAQEAANGDEGTKQAAEILQAVAMFASDPALAANIAKMVDDGKTGERAVLEGFGQVEEMFRQIGGYQGEPPTRAARESNESIVSNSTRARPCGSVFRSQLIARPFKAGMVTCALAPWRAAA
mgnify:CR=1 FL=1